MKTCSKCKANKSCDSFCKGRSECKECAKRYREENRQKIRNQKRIYYQENKEHILQRCSIYEKNNINKVKECKKKYRDKHREEYRIYAREYATKNKKIMNQKAKARYEKNKKSVAKKHAEWRAKNPDYSKNYQVQYNANPKNRERRRKYRREYEKKHKKQIAKRRRKRVRERKKTDIHFAITERLRSSFYSAVRLDLKKSSVLTLLGLSVPKFKLYIENQFLVGMDWSNWGHGHGKWNLDHIIPVAAFDMSKEDEQKKCWNYMNFRPLWHRDNLMKSDILPCGRRARKIGKVGSLYINMETS